MIPEIVYTLLKAIKKRLKDESGHEDHPTIVQIDAVIEILKLHEERGR